uniref:Transmembrane protein n=1 Tax=Hyaloperonospora arabidopsidis (strain Emoy2) TaxID=559515 RepID=M4BGA4_HYAAE
MSSYTDDAFDCESPHAILSSCRGFGRDQRYDPQLVNTMGSSRPESGSEGDGTNEVTYEKMAQPRPEIILRWKRFALLVVLVAAVMSSIAEWLREGFVVDKNVPVSEAENKTDVVNSYLGLMMGFVESFIGLGVEEIFPVFVVYLHNLKWYPGDDPATKKQSKLKKFALTIFIPTVMMAVSSSLSAVQANQKDDNGGGGYTTTTELATTRFLVRNVTELEGDGLGDTIMKTALARKVEPMQPPDASMCSNDNTSLFSAEMLLAAAPKAIFGFRLPDWGADFADGWSNREIMKNRELSHLDADGHLLQNDVMSLATAYKLWVQGRAILLKSIRDDKAPRGSTPPSSTDELLADIFNFLLDTELPLVDGAAVDASFESLEVSSSINLDAMILKVPIRGPSNASVICGESSCAWLRPQLNSKGRLPRKQIGITQLKENCSLSDECDSVRNVAFLYGFTTVTNVERDTAAPTSLLILSFARLSWRFESDVYECESGADQDEGCQVLRYQLGGNDRHLVQPKQKFPVQLQTGLAVPISLVQLVEPKTRQLGAEVSPSVTLEYLESWPLARTHTCDRSVEAYLQYVNSNHLYMGDDMLETMVATALLFIFQDARIIDGAPSVIFTTAKRRLVDATTARRVKIFLTNTRVGNVCTWTGCGVLLLLTALVLALPNERARLAPPRGGNARAERFVAVQTEQIYPNLIYKKRFLIGKTGEEIKFNEFAVESVGLHHKMEEDEQIYI